MLKPTILLATMATFAGASAFAGDCNWGKHAEMSMAETAVEETQPAVLPEGDLTIVASLACAELSGDALLTCLDTEKTKTN